MKTKFDRWLIQTYIYKTYFYTLQIPDQLPNYCSVEKLEDLPGKRFKYKLTATSTKESDELIVLMKDQGLTFKTDVIERNPWYGHIINPKKKSFTWRMFWFMVILVSVLLVIIKLVPIIQSEEFQNLKRSYLGSLHCPQS